MRADRLRSGDHVVVVAAEVGSVFTEDGLTFVTYNDPHRTGEVLDADRSVGIVCMHVEQDEEDDDA